MQAIIAASQLSINEGKLNTSMERLSSGLKINHAKDDPSGLAIAKRMNAQIKGIEISETSTKNGISVIETAEGALNEVHSMLQRMNELAVQASNGTMGDDERGYIQDEIEALQEEIERIASDTAFNGQGLLDGSFDYKAYTNTADVQCDYYSNSVEVKEYDILINSVTTDVDGNITDVDVTLEGNEPNDFPVGTEASWVDNQLVITAPDGFEMKLSINPDTADGTAATIDATGIGAMRLQVGANEGQVMVVRIPEISLESMGIADLTLETQDDARDSLEKIANGISYVSSIRASLGAYQNRMEHTTASLATTAENLTNAHSRIMDTDMAKEMTYYTTYQVMTQAGTAMVAQANERPQMVLQLLQ